MNDNSLIYSSRSRIESFLDCPRLGYIRYLWDGRGITKRAASVYLSTGTYTHIGLEILFRLCQPNNRIPPEEIIDEVVKKSLEAHNNEIQSRGFDLEEGEDKANELYIITEQCALVEAFIRAFAIRILPDILNRFKVVDVEREEQVTVGSLVMQGRIDLILEEISTSDLYIISFKTAAQWDRRQEKANEHDNQGLSETWILEERLKAQNNELANIVHTMDSVLLDSESKYPKQVIDASEKYLKYLEKFRKPEKIMGVIMIYLLKGKRYESSSIPGRWEQHSPLIRAYRKLVGTQYEYAPSLYFNNPSNKSGKGRLGKGWEPFNIWEDEEVGFIKGWIAKLANPNQNMGEDIIGNSFKIPAPYFRNQEHVDSWVRQSRSIEKEIEYKINQVEAIKSLRNEALDLHFPQRRKGCHYPVDCEMLDICYNSEVFNDPIGSGKYIYRKPHHKMEMEAHEKLYNISNNIRAEVSKEESNGTSEGTSTNNNNRSDNSQSRMEGSSDKEIDILDEEVIIDD